MEFTLSRAVEILHRSPGAYRALLVGLSDDWTLPDEGPDTFSAWDNLAHVVFAERSNWVGRARQILEQGADRRFQPFDRLAFRTEFSGWSAEALCDEFERLRAANLAELERLRLTDRELAMEGEHPTFGTVTLRQLLATWVVHDLSHLAQTARVLSKQYREAVGPWRAFLPILDRGGSKG